MKVLRIANKLLIYMNINLKVHYSFLWLNMDGKNSTVSSFYLNVIIQCFAHRIKYTFKCFDTFLYSEFYFNF